MSAVRQPFAVHRLPNGWEVREFHANSQRVFFEEPANPKRLGELGRFVARYNRRHHIRRLTVIHLIGSTREEQGRSLAQAIRMASRPSRFPYQGLWARRRDPHYAGKHFFTIILGDGVDEAKAFQHLSLSLKSDDEIETQFQSIVEAFELDEKVTR